MADDDIDRLKAEIARVDRKLDLLLGPEREAGAAKVRQTLREAGSWAGAEDERVLSLWVAGEIHIDALVAHFGARISKLP